MLYRKIAKWTKKRNFDWIIFWHYHLPDHRLVNDIDCINCWDWVISCTAVVENDNWNMELIYY
jgi:UDP-2,3-diacylglucosamine pyrophosphatase LpxH